MENIENMENTDILEKESDNNEADTEKIRLEEKTKELEELKLILEEEKIRISEKENSLNQMMEKQNLEMNEKENKILYQKREIESKIQQIEIKEKYLYELEEKLKSRELLLNNKEIEYSQKESDFLRKKEELEFKENSIKDMQNTVNEKLNAIAKKENALTVRESELAEREFSEKEELAAKKLEFENNLREEKIRMFDSVNEEISKIREDSYDQIKKEHEEYVKSLSEREFQLKEKLNRFEDEKASFEFDREQLEAEKKNISHNMRNIDMTVKKKIDNEIARIESERENWTRQRKDLFDRINEYQQKITKFEKIIERFGDNPEAIFDEFRIKQDRINELNQIIMNFDESKVNDYDSLLKDKERIESEKEEYRKRYQELHEKISETETLIFENGKLALQNKRLKEKNETLEVELNNYIEKIKRLNASVDPADESQRIAEIKKGILPELTNEMIERSKNEQPESEILWLKHIETRCKEFGIVFPHRILYAFHTALKISDWSTITVLAGVSGTGKSELPRLYSQFGGIQFINVPVQPNWDSKESMLGYFNSIDNRFEAQDVLRFLAQCTDMNSYGRCMAIVLLDEMNLAHVELYFAEFLSKLEERRGKGKDNVPEIEVKLGSGMKPYGIKMSRNILWTGTMNQDETTNSLSDKVLDRGIVINFPRPTELLSRNAMKNIDTVESEPLLQQNTWKKWLTRKLEFEGKQADKIENYRKIVNNINNQLEKVGRALGHRVWQSIEYYIANYPTVIEEIRKIKSNPDIEPGTATPAFKSAVKTAFEDQIVQKIMPKLRGIETSGIGQEALEEIEKILLSEGFENLREDYENAMQLGYGQFMWNSAKYIDKSEEYAEESEPQTESESEKDGDNQ